MQTQTKTQTRTTGVTTIALLVLRTGELKIKLSSATILLSTEEFRFNDASTHEGHLRQNGVILLSTSTITASMKKQRPRSASTVIHRPVQAVLSKLLTKYYCCMVITSRHRVDKTIYRCVLWHENF